MIPLKILERGWELLKGNFIPLLFMASGWETYGRARNLVHAQGLLSRTNGYSEEVG
jgi:hypothetical protein